MVYVVHNVVHSAESFVNHSGRRSLLCPYLRNDMCAGGRNCKIKKNLWCCQIKHVIGIDYSFFGHCVVLKKDKLDNLKIAYPIICVALNIAHYYKLLLHHTKCKK